MKKATIKQYYRAGAIIAVVLAAIPLMNAAHLTFAASTSTLALLPTSQAVTTGSNVVVSVVLTTNGSAINAVQSQFTYSPANYSFVSITAGPSLTNFAVPLESSGVIQFSAGTPAGAAAINGTTTAATITLHATGTGTSALGLGAVCGAGVFTNSACSIAFDSSTDNNDLSGVSGVSYTVNAVPVVTNPTPPTNPTTPSGSGSSGKTSSGGSTAHASASTSSGSTSTGSSTPSSTNSGSSSTAAPTATTTTTNPAPVISDINVNNITSSSATVSWTTNVPSTSIVNYGFDTSYGLLVQDPTLNTSHQVTINSPALAQGTHYFFKVSSATATGASNTSSSQEFTTLGYTITIRVVDAHGKLVKGAEVFLDGQTKTTNSAGAVTLQNVLSGSQSVTIKIGSKVTRRTINVNSNPTSGTTKLQQFSLSAVRSSTNPLYYIVTILIIFMATGGALFMPRRHLHHYQAAMAGASIGTDPDIAGTSRPLTSDSSSSTDHTGSLIDSVNPDNLTHEPGQVITPSAPNGDDTASSTDNGLSDIPELPENPESLIPSEETPETPTETPESAEIPEPEAPEAPAAEVPAEPEEPSTPTPPPADDTPAEETTSAEPEVIVPTEPAEPTEPEPAEPAATEVSQPPAAEEPPELPEPPKTPEA